MRKLALVLAIPLVASVAACGATEGFYASPTSQASYLAVAHKNMAYGGNTDKDLLSLGDTTCAMFEGGLSWNDAKGVVTTGTDPMTVADFTYMTTASIRYLCPSYTKDIPS